MLIYLLDEENNFLKLHVVDGNPFGVTWTSRVYMKEKVTGKWKFISKSSFECSLHNGVTLVIKNKNHRVTRFYIQKMI